MMNESQVRRNLMKALVIPGYRCSFDAIHGGPYQKAGLPDIVGCVEGAYIGFEVKLMRKLPIRDDSMVFGSGYSFTELQAKVAKDKISAKGQIYGLTYIQPWKLLLMSPVETNLPLTVGELKRMKEDIRKSEYGVGGPRYSSVWDAYILMYKKGRGFPILQVLAQGLV